MLAEVVAPEAVGAGFDLTIGLGLLFSLAVLIGTRFAWEHTFGALINGLANVLKIHVWRINLNLSGPLLKFEATIQDAMGRAILRNEQALGLWWNATTAVIRYTADALEWFASSTVHAFSNLVHGTIPQAVTVVTRPIANDLGKLRAALRAQAITLERDLTKRAKGLEAELERDFGKAWHGIDYLRGTAIPSVQRLVHGLDAEVGTLERQVGRVIPRRLSRLEKLLGVGVLSGIAIAALTRVFPWWQCRNVRNVARSLCRFPTGLLTALLGDALEAAVVLNICEAVGIMSKIATAFFNDGAVTAIIGKFESALDCADEGRPPELAVRGVSLPSVEAFADLPAV